MGVVASMIGGAFVYLGRGPVGAAAIGARGNVKDDFPVGIEELEGGDAEVAEEGSAFAAPIEMSLARHLGQVPRIRPAEPGERLCRGGSGQRTGHPALRRMERALTPGYPSGIAGGGQIVGPQQGLDFLKLLFGLERTDFQVRGHGA